MNIVNRLRQIFKNNRKIYKIMSLIYRKLVLPIISGHSFYNLKYNIFVKNKEICQLEQMGLSNICVFKQNTWRIGRSEDKALRRYYTGNYANLPCFVKIASGDKTVENEINIQKKIHKKFFQFTPKYLTSIDAVSGQKSILVVEYLIDLHPIPDNPSYDLLISISRQFNNILDSFAKIGLVHADIHRGNMLLDSKENLVILDFGISKFVDVDNNVNYIERPGTYYKQIDNYRIYDDAYSFVQMIKKLDVQDDFYNTNEYKLINNKIGKVQVKVFTERK